MHTQKTQRTAAQTRPLSVETQKQIKHLVKEHGESETAQLLGIAKTALWRALAGLNLRAGTVLMIETAVARINAR